MSERDRLPERAGQLPRHLLCAAPPAAWHSCLLMLAHKIQVSFEGACMLSDERLQGSLKVNDALELPQLRLRKKVHAPRPSR